MATNNTDTLNVINRKSEQITLVTEEQVKTFTPISANKATTTLIAHIITSQDLHICKVLGSILYKKLMVEFIANNKQGDQLPDGTATGITPQVSGDDYNYKELYELIVKPLCWWSYVLSLSTTAMNVAEQGILLRSTENSESAGLDGLRKVTADGEATARSYMQILQDYLDNDNCKENSKEDGINVGGASLGIFTPRKKWHGKKNY